MPIMPIKHDKRWLPVGPVVLVLLSAVA